VTIAVYAPLVCAVLLALIAAPVARRARPSSSLWLFAAAAAVVGLASVWSLVMLASMLIDDIPGYAGLQHRIPVPDAISVTASVLLGAGLVRAILTGIRRHRDRGALPSGPGGSGTVIVPSGSVDAFAVADSMLRRTGTIYVTAGLLGLLDRDQIRIVLAHEAAHLSRRHALARGLVAYAAAAVPVLVPMRDAVEFLCERDADECAAALGSRTQVARTVAIAALARSGARATRLAPALHRLAVADRVGALTAVRRGNSGWHLTTLAVALVVTAAAVGEATRDFADIAAAVVR
jgi:Zn-dependent protease with chaperone function